MPSDFPDRKAKRVLPEFPVWTAWMDYRDGMETEATPGLPG